MLFNSFEFAVFFPVIVTLYFLLPHPRRWILLLVGSYYFYGSWQVEFLALILASTLIDYFAAQKIAAAKDKRRRVGFLLLSILGNMGPLLVFKYLDFFNSSIAELANIIGWNYPIEALNLILPVGISFYSFQTLSYTIDVFNKKIQPENHFGIFALYVSYFPQLVAGPIERPGNLIPQLRKKISINWARIRSGLTQMLWGFFMKLVIADRAAVIVNQIYDSPQKFDGLPLVFATVFFAFQILGDFAGYSNIAIGASRILGIDLMKNFDRPYFSKSIAEFWRRWHISLSTWFRDYVYIPLGGNRVVKWRLYYNILITFTISGLWHGAAWTFIAWGVLHGLYMVIGHITLDIRSKFKRLIGLKQTGLINRIWQVSFVFVLVCIGWVLFRATTFDDAVYILTNLHTNLSEQISEIESFRDLARMLKVSASNLMSVIVGITVLLIVNLYQRRADYYQHFLQLPTFIRWSAYYLIILLILFFGSFEGEDFIYFQF